MWFQKHMSRTHVVQNIQKHIIEEREKVKSFFAAATLELLEFKFLEQLNQFGRTKQ